MTVADQVGALLAELGVGHAFGVVGSGNLHVTNALRAAGVPYVAARHEGGAATMADGGVAIAAADRGPGMHVRHVVCEERLGMNDLGLSPQPIDDVPRRTRVRSRRSVPGVRYASVPMIGLMPRSRALA